MIFIFSIAFQWKKQFKWILFCMHRSLWVVIITSENYWHFFAWSKLALINISDSMNSVCDFIPNVLADKSIEKWNFLVFKFLSQSFMFYRSILMGNLCKCWVANNFSFNKKENVSNVLWNAVSSASPSLCRSYSKCHLSLLH